MQTIHIPANMSEAAQAVTGRDFEGMSPIFVFTRSANPDEFDFAVYEDPATVDSYDSNERAAMLAEFTGNEGPVYGDVFLRCPEDLAKMFLENDQKWQAKTEASKAFKDWMQQYATNTGQDVMDVFDAVAAYMSCVVERAIISRDQAAANALAEALGIDPERVGVVVL